MSARGLPATARALGLPFDDEIARNWGVIVADADRVEEFTRYWTRQFDVLDAEERTQLVDLIVQSANEALQATSTVEPRMAALLRDVVRRREDDVVRSALQYWAELEDMDAWPASVVLRDLLRGA